MSVRDVTMCRQTRRNGTRRTHTQVGVSVVNVEVSENGHVVIGVRIVQCYHAIMANSEFPFLVPIVNLLSGCMI